MVAIMNLKILLISFLLTLCGLSVVCQNATSLLDPKIVGGSAIQVRNRRYQVSLLFSGYLCGGSLIKYNWILTAAHCMKGVKPSSVQVRAGSSYTYKGGVTGRGEKIIVHSRFSPRTMTFDIALLKVQYGFKKWANQFYIRIIPIRMRLPKVGFNLRVSGFGTLYSGGPVSTSLRAVTVKKDSWKKCNKQYNHQLTSTMFCAGQVGKDSCQGDSGGPITFRGRLVGLVSWGNGCATIYPGIYTNVVRLRGWVWKHAR